MNTVYAGKQLLKHLENKRGGKIDPKTFFDIDFWPVMFDAPDHQHLMQVHSSDFGQPSYPSIAKKAGKPLAAFRKEKFDNNLEQTKSGLKPAAGNMGVGFMASGPKETTFGQVTDLPLNFTEEELLCSWFGGALGIGFGGGYDFLTLEPEIFEFIYEGWPFYRELIKDTPRLKGKQIQAWNGLWLCYGLKYRDNPKEAYRKVKQHINTHIKTTNGIAKLDRPDWSTQVLNLAAEFGGAEGLILQGYSHGSQNKTLGSIMVQLPKVRGFAALFKQLVEQDDTLPNKALQDVFKEEFTMSKAARYGQLGLLALTPAKLTQLLYEDETSKTNLPKDPYQFKIYKSWIIAMLNNDEIYELATKLALDLLNFKEKGKDKFSTEADKKKHIETLFSMKKNARFIEQLSEIAKEMDQTPEHFREASKAAATQMTPEQFQLFISALRFEYVYHLDQTEA